MRILLKAGNCAVAVEGGRIIEPSGAYDVVLDLPGAEIRPGLINAHDHLHRNHYGRLGKPPYRDACHWAEDIQVRYQRRIARGRRLPRRSALLEGAWKNLFAGVTTVVHHDRWEPAFERDFPLRVVRAGNADSLGMDPDLGPRGANGPFCVHVAEGIGAEAAEEVRQLDARGLLNSSLVAVHGVGLDANGIGRLRAAGAALVWCPTSNLFLLGRTAPAALLRSGIDVLLGSDSLLTANGNLLDELRVARAYGALTDSELEAAVGAKAALRFALPPPSLNPGAIADLVILTKPLLDARAEDVALVMVAGVPRVARPDLAPALKGVAGCGAEKKVGSVVRWTNSRSADAFEGDEHD